MKRRIQRSVKIKINKTSLPVQWTGQLTNIIISNDLYMQNKSSQLYQCNMLQLKR